MSIHLEKNDLKAVTFNFSAFTEASVTEATYCRKFMGKK